MISHEPRDLGHLQVKIVIIPRGESGQTRKIGVYRRLWYLDSKKSHVKGSTKVFIEKIMVSSWLLSKSDRSQTIFT